jgi:hypothetical protein
LDALIRAFIERIGERERQTIEVLNSMKMTISLQMEGFKLGIFIINAVSSEQLHQSLMGVFRYAETVLLPPKQTPESHTENKAVKADNPVSNVAAVKDLAIENLSIAQSNASEPSDTNPVVSADESDSEPGATFDAQDFPELGADKHVSKPKEENIRHSKRQGNQKQRKDEIRSDRAKGQQIKPQWTLMKNENESILVDSTDISRRVYIFLNLGTIQRDNVEA